jgi:hypothetical protein
VDVTTTELADVSRDLCVVASLLFAANRLRMASTIVDQAVDLLILRGRLFRSRRSPPASGGAAKDSPTSALVLLWMN